MSRPLLFARSLVFALLIVIATVIWAIACFGFLLLPYRQRYWMIIRWNVFITYAAKYVCGIHWTIKGFENLPDTPVILLSKHQSAWETIFYCWAMPRPMIFVFKKSLLLIPFFGWGLAMLEPIAIDRKAGTKALRQTYEQGSDRLSRGFWIVVFPEGTRVAPGEDRPFQSGGAWLAVKAGATVLPVAHNAGHCWPRNAWKKRPGTITVRIGEPIRPDGLTTAALNARAEQWIKTAVRELDADEIA